MLILNAVRTALLSDQPWLRLDELVRAELAAGHTTRQIYKSLMGMADEIDATPGLSEDGSDALGDTLDALTGYCHRDCQYTDPPNVTLPSEEEIEELPRWARVAFAARCARRVLAFWTGWPDASKKALLNTITATEFAERAAKTGYALPESVETAKNASVTAAVAASGSGSPSAEAAARAVARAVEAAADDTAPYTVVPFTARVTAEAAEAAAEAVNLAHSYTAIQHIIRRDFEHLANLADWQNWTDDTPVPPEVFGPLWPEGPPKGWPPINDVPPRTDLLLESFARERATEQMIADDIVNLFNALNRYHIARSGVRLTLEQFRSLISALVPAEV
jgi:hypothetical protein